MVAKTALFTGPLHINVARKVAAINAATAASPWTPYVSFFPTSLWDSSLLLMFVGVGPSSR